MRTSSSHRHAGRIVPATTLYLHSGRRVPAGAPPRREYRELLRYWTLDLDLHKTKLRQLRHNVQTTAADGTETRWYTYVDTLSHRGLTSKEVADAARNVWRAIRSIAPTIPPPDASPTNSRGLLMSWDASGRFHLEIEILPDTSYEWFYRERAADVSDGGEEANVDVLPEALVARLLNVKPL